MADDVASVEIARLRAALAAAEARISVQDAYIQNLHLQIALVKQEKYGSSAERSAKLGQLELQLEELETAATEDAIAADIADRNADPDALPRPRRHPVRKPFPKHFTRERVIVPAPTSCTCCGSNRLSKLGEDVTETLEVIPRQFKVIQTVREKFTCRDCEKISQPPAPFHAIPRGHVGPALLAGMLYEKVALHQPLNRQSAEFGAQGIDLPLSTLADHVGSATAVLRPLFELIEAHVFAAERLHSDDTPVPLLAKGKTKTARLWTNVRDDSPFGGEAPPAAAFYFSRDRAGVHPQQQLASFTGVLQADAYSGYKQLYEPGRSPGPIYEAACWAHARRNFYKLADLAKAARDPKFVISPIAHEAVRRIDAIFAIEAAINRTDAARRVSVRQARTKPLVEDFRAWGQREQARLAKGPVSKAFKYLFERWPSFTRFLDDGRVCMSNNAAERSIRAVALGRKAWPFAGSDRGGERAAMMYSLIATCKLNSLEPRAWLTHVLTHIADCPSQRLHDLLPWKWRSESESVALAA